MAIHESESRTSDVIYGPARFVRKHIVFISGNSSYDFIRD